MIPHHVAILIAAWAECFWPTHLARAIIRHETAMKRRNIRRNYPD
jgi:hypothetical protein